MKHLTLGVVALSAFAALSLCGPEAARAGSVLLSRESTIRASGGDGSAEYDLHGASDDFDGFSDTIDTFDAGMGGPRASANQNSRPALGADGAFAGAYAEGSATVEGESEAFAEAASAFDLTFEVTGEPSWVSVGGSVGAFGNATTSVSLCNQVTGEVLLAQELMASPGGDGRSIDHSKMLQPGVYELLITANVNCAPDESMAYYAVNLRLEPGAATAIPLPPAAWSAAGTLAAAGFIRGWRRVRHRVAG
jgi:hypothetical protein